MFGPRRLRDVALPLNSREIAVHALIIEDEHLIAMAIEDILRDSGFTSLDFASSPQAAIDSAEIRCPDLITSDVQLRPGCGIETVLTICHGTAIPVIFITGNVADVIERLPNSFILAKPFSNGQLAEAVAIALQ